MPPGWGEDWDRDRHENRPSEALGMEMSHAHPMCSPSRDDESFLGEPLLGCWGFFNVVLGTHLDASLKV